MNKMETVKKCDDCGQEETESYLEEIGELIEFKFLGSNGDTVFIYYCENCNSKYFPSEDTFTSEDI